MWKTLVKATKLTLRDKKTKKKRDNEERTTIDYLEATWRKKNLDSKRITQKTKLTTLKDESIYYLYETHFRRRYPVRIEQIKKFHKFSSLTTALWQISIEKWKDVETKYSMLWILQMEECTKLKCSPNLSPIFFGNQYLICIRPLT